MIKLGIARIARFLFRVSYLLVQLTMMPETGVAEKWW